MVADVVVGAKVEKANDLVATKPGGLWSAQVAVAMELNPPRDAGDRTVFNYASAGGSPAKPVPEADQPAPKPVPGAALTASA